jgi:hypothetical protein
LARAGHTPTSRHHLHPMSRACNIIRQQKSPNYHVIWNVRWGQSLRGSVFCSNHGGWLFSPPLIFSLHSLKFVSSQPKIKNQGCPIYCLTIMILFSFDWNFFVLDYFLNCFFFSILFIFHLILFCFLYQMWYSFSWLLFFMCFFLSILSHNILFYFIVFLDWFFILLIAFFFLSFFLICFFPFN